MKKLLIISVFLVVSLLSVVLYSKTRMQLVNVYICESTLIMAELSAKVAVNRKELISVSYCKCEGIHPSMKSEVKNMNCEAPKNNVYLCVCSGKYGY